MKIFILTSLLSLLFAFHSSGQEDLKALAAKEVELIKCHYKPAGNEYVKTYLFSDLARVAKGGKIKIGILFDIADGMNIYSPAQNSSNLPTVIKWELPRGVKLEQVHWQTPIEVGDGKKGYMENCIVMADLSIDANIDATNVEIQANISFQVCDELYCRQGEATNKLSFSIGKNAKTKVAKMFNK